MAIQETYTNDGSIITLGDGVDRVRHIKLATGTDMPALPFRVRLLPSGQLVTVSMLPYLEQWRASQIQLVPIVPSDAVQQDAITFWDVQGAVTQTASTFWDILGAVQQNASTFWDVEGAEPPPPPPDPPPGTFTATVNIPGPFSLPLPNQVAGNWQYNTDWAVNVAVVNGNLRWNFPAGFEGGTSPGRAVINDINQYQFGVKYIVDVDVRFSVPWTRHPTADKILYIGEMTLRDQNPGTQAGQMYIGRIEDGWLGATVQASQGGEETCPIPFDSARNFPCGPNEPWLNQTRIDDGLWHQIRVECTGSTNGEANGGLTVYVDGLQQWNSTNVRWTPLDATRFYGINLDPVWGGGEDVFKPANEWMELGSLVVRGQ